MPRFNYTRISNEQLETNLLANSSNGNFRSIKQFLKIGSYVTKNTTPHFMEDHFITKATLTGMVDAQIPDYKEIIHLTHIARDESAGIKVTEIKDMNQNFMIRDTRNPNILPPNHPDLTKYPYQIQFMNMARSAETLLKLEQKGDDKLVKKIRQFAKDGYKKLDTIGHEEGSDKEKSQQRFLLLSQDRLLKELEKAVGRDVSKDLQLTMDYANFEDDHHHTATISEIKGKTVVQTDVALLGYTDDQKTMLGCGEDKNFNVNNLYQKEFFQKLPEFEKKLFKKHYNAISSGTKVQNTQLRNIPGAKNAYESGVYIVDGENQLQERLTELRIGTLYSTNKSKDSKSITNSNLQQLNEITGKNIHLNTLVTPVPIPLPVKKLDIERQLYSATTEAANIKGNNLHSNVALNNTRRLVINKYDGAQTLIDTIADSLDKLTTDELGVELKKYFEDSKSIFANFKKNKSTELIKKLTESDSQKKDFLINVIKLNERIHQNKGIDSENIGIEINQLISVVIQEAKTLGGLAGTNLENLENLISCKSGKDRTGMQATFNTVAAIREEIGGKDDLSIATDLLNTGHFQLMSAKQGGRQGCFGILKGTSQAIPGEFKEIKSLISLPAASFNKDKIDTIDRKPTKSEEDLLFNFNKDEGNKQTIIQEEKKEEEKNKTSPLIVNKKDKMHFDDFDKLEKHLLKINLTYIEDLKKLENTPNHKAEQEYLEYRKDTINTFVLDVGTKLKKIDEVVEERQDKNIKTFGDKDTGYIKVTISNDGKFSFEPKNGDNNKGINCIYPIPNKTGGHDILKFENGELTSVIYADESKTNLNKANIKELEGAHLSSIKKEAVNILKQALKDLDSYDALKKVNPVHQTKTR